MDSIGLQAYSRVTIALPCSLALIGQKTVGVRRWAVMDKVAKVTWACTNDWNGQAVGVELGAIWGDEANTILASLWGSISRSGAC